MGKSVVSKLVAYTVLCILWARGTFAYIDPGTGGIVVGGIGSFFVFLGGVIVGFLLKYVWTPIRKGIRVLWQSRKGKS
jgi:hypothetical protein